jgi:hypothetical protein
LKTTALSAFIGVYQRPKIVFPDFSIILLTALRRDRARKGKDDTDAKMNPCVPSRMPHERKRNWLRKEQYSGELAQPLNARSISGLARARAPFWLKVTHKFLGRAN